MRHDLRHTGLTWMADAGVPVHVLRKLAGHGSLTTRWYLYPDQRSITGDPLTPRHESGVWAGLGESGRAASPCTIAPAGSG